MRTKRLGGLLSLTTLVLGLLVAGTASAATVNCGDVVTTDVTLDGPLAGCGAAGLVVGSDGLVIDLNGHSITGTGEAQSAGVQIQGRSGVTVTNGYIAGFARGVAADAAPFTSALALSVERADTGIELAWGSGGGRVAHNVVTDTHLGIRLLFSGGTTLEHNVARGNDAGIQVEFSSGPIRHNVASDNTGSGIALLRSGYVEGVVDNVANGNGQHGINAHDNHGLYLSNVTNNNGNAGLYLTDAVAGHGQFFTVRSHVANSNGSFGILAAMPGVVDGGHNIARANGDARQCENITCNTRPSP